MMVQRIEKVTLLDQVAGHLRELILNGDLAPGAHLREVELARQLGVSRGSLREALIKLEGEGLVASSPGRGTFVAQLQENDIEEIYGLRLLLEKEAVRLATQRLTPAEAEALRELADAVFAAGAAGDIPAVLRQNQEFHSTIWRLSGNRRLAGLLDTLYSQARVYLAFTIHYQDRELRRRTDEQHRQIVMAMAAGDAAGALTIMEAHLTEAERLLQLFLDKVPSAA